MLIITTGMFLEISVLPVVVLLNQNGAFRFPIRFSLLPDTLFSILIFKISTGLGCIFAACLIMQAKRDEKW